MVLNEKGIIKEFDLVIYPTHLIVVIGELSDKVHQLYKPDDPQYDSFLPPDDDHPCKTYTVLNKKDNGFDIMVWVKDLESCRGHYFCHEVGHVALEIFKYTGAIVDVENQEPFCYLLGNLYRLMAGAYDELFEFKKKSKKKK